MRALTTGETSWTGGPLEEEGEGEKFCCCPVLVLLDARPSMAS